MNEQQKKMDEMVQWSFEYMGRLSLNFNQPNQKINPNARVIKTREIKILKNGKFIYARQFSDSANPERNKTIIKKENNENDR